MVFWVLKPGMTVGVRPVRHPTEAMVSDGQQLVAYVQ